MRYLFASNGRSFLPLITKVWQLRGCGIDANQRELRAFFFVLFALLIQRPNNCLLQP
jgi:hypothetical protein